MERIIKRIIAVAIAVVVAVAAWAGDFVEVTGTHVRLRQSPSLQGKIFTGKDGNPIYPAKGELIDLTGESGDFYQVNYKGTTLYISKQYSRRVTGVEAKQRAGKPAGTQASAAGKKVFPGAKEAKPAEKPAAPVGKKATPAATGEPTPREVIVTGTNVRLRSGASLKSPALQDAKGNNLHPAKGQKLQCVGQQGEFYKVVFNGLTAYISKQYATPAQ